MFKASKYQEDFFNVLENTNSNIVLEAVAGSGKSTTIIQAILRMPEYVRKNTIVIAFNKHIADAMTEKLKGLGVDVKTSHGVGFGAICRYYGMFGKTNYVNDKKEFLLFQEWSKLNFERLPQDLEVMQDFQKQVLQVVGYCKVMLNPAKTLSDLEPLIQRFELDDVSELQLNAIQYIMDSSVNHPAYGSPMMLSYDDMIWLPSVLNLTFRAYQIVFVDEAQDLNAAQSWIAARLSSRGRAIYVGDKRQSIFGFTGADTESFEKFTQIPNTKCLPLSICYRCPKSVVALAKTIVPQIESAPNAPEGKVETITNDRATSMMKAGDMVLCRMTAPLITLAFSLIRQGTAAKVRGRDIGTQLVNMIDVLYKKNHSFEEFGCTVNEWATSQTEKLRLRGEDEYQLTAIDDKASSLLAIYDSCMLFGVKTIPGMRAHVLNLFGDDANVVMLSTVHKAKGLESDRVFIIKPELLPFPKAKKDFEVQQEQNLCYVAYTRAMKELYFVRK